MSEGLVLYSTREAGVRLARVVATGYKNPSCLEPKKSEPADVRVIQTTAVVGQDRRMVIELPTDVDPGTHRVVVVFEPEAETKAAPDFRADWPSHQRGGDVGEG